MRNHFINILPMLEEDDEIKIYIIKIFIINSFLLIIQQENSFLLMVLFTFEGPLNSYRQSI